MFTQIKYTYITKEQSTKGVVTSLTHAIKSVDSMLNEYRVIDNIELGVRIYPGAIQNNVIRCHKEDVLNKVNELIEDDIDVILLNGFDIDLDTVREVYAPIVEESEILLCINELHNIDENVSVNIDPSVHSMNNDKWNEIKEDIEDSIEDIITEYELDDLNRFDFLNKTIPSKKTPVSKKLDSDIFKDMFLSSIDKDDKLNGITPEVTYSQMLNNKELTITKTTDGCLVIDNEIDMITIEKDQLDFFINTISNLLK